MAHFSKRAAFTIPELLVSMAIIGVMTGMMLANFRDGQKTAEVRFAAEILSQQLRDTQTSALSGRLIGVCGGGTDSGVVCDSGKNPPVVCGGGGSCGRIIPNGYGLRFTEGSKTYMVYFDTNNDGGYDVGEELNNPSYVSTDTVLLVSSSIPLPFDVVFKPPNGKISFVSDTGVELAAETVELRLKHATSAIERAVSIFRVAGRIEHD